MTDFETMVARLRNTESCAYVEGKHFEIWEWEESGKKTIEMRPSTLTDEWISFNYDKDGNLINIS